MFRYPPCVLQEEHKQFPLGRYVYKRRLIKTAEFVFKNLVFLFCLLCTSEDGAEKDDVTRRPRKLHKRDCYIIDTVNLILLR
jgi:hypothetical protein